jgi:hypothetical protein
MDDLKKQLARAITEEERLKIVVAMEDHNLFWHPLNCE